MRLLIFIASAVCLCTLVKAGDVDEKKAEELGQAVEKTMTALNPSVVDATFDVDLLTKAAIGSLDTPEKTKTEFRRTIIDTMRFGANIVQQMGPASDYKFLRARTADGKTRLLFRFLNNDGLNYHEYAVARRGDGLCFTDLYVWAPKDSLSEVLRRTFLIVASGEDPAVFERAGGNEALMAKYRPIYQALVVDCFEGKFEDAKAAYEKLPAELHNDKSIIALRVRYASGLGDKEYEDALAAYEQASPHDPSLELMAIDLDLIRKQYDRALKRVDSLDAGVGGDPFLDAFRARVYGRKGDVDKSKELMNTILEKEPHLAQAYIVGLELAVARKDWPETARLLINTEKNTPIFMGDLTRKKMYKEFVRTDEFKKFQEERPKK